jgi:hypothetical protein
MKQKSDIMMADKTGTKPSGAPVILTSVLCDRKAEIMNLEVGTGGEK